LPRFTSFTSFRCSTDSSCASKSSFTSNSRRRSHHSFFII
jgi:hypothetical protein